MTNVLHLRGSSVDGRGGFRTCDLSRVKRDELGADVAYLQGKSRAARRVSDRNHPVPAGFCREFGTTLSQTRLCGVRRCFRAVGHPGLTVGAPEVVGGLDPALCDRSAPMSVADAPELLIELLTEAARTPGGQVGLLRAAQVAQILGRHRDWVQTHATQLGGFRLPDSDEWRFAPRGVAHGILGLDDDASADSPLPSSSASPRRRASARQLAYPPARQVLADRPRHAGNDRQGGSHASPDPRDD
ncbi:MAG: hypothetical protein QOK16_3194 [Solirubrobacteraceae bacterium]|nr:hypothetical protein [Solirubrobacteraceae bacterium]